MDSQHEEQIRQVMTQATSALAHLKRKRRAARLKFYGLTAVTVVLVLAAVALARYGMSLCIEGLAIWNQ